MKNLKRMLALLLALAMFFSMAACSKDPETSSTAANANPSGNPSPSASNNNSSSDPGNPNYNLTKPLVVAYGEFSSKFSPFYAETVYDSDVYGLCSLNLMTTDRLGAVIKNGINGETKSYNGTDYTYTGPADLEAKYDIPSGQSIYTATLRKDLKFWDGTPVTARDIVFTYYVCLDPSFVGSSSLASYDIVGLENWRTQTSSAVHDKYAAKAARILSDGRGSGYTSNDEYTQEMYDDFWNWVDEQWTTTVKGFVEYVNYNYDTDEDAAEIGCETYDEIAGNEGLRIAFGMTLWGFAALNEDGTLTDGTNTWDLKTTYPTVEDFVNATKEAYNNNPATFFEKEASGEENTTIVDYASSKLISEYGPKDPEMADQHINSIEGIKMVDDYTVEITVNGYSAPAIYDILGIYIAPMHYYGEASKWDPDNGKYGFDRGDLSHVMSVTEVPRGAGPYIFESFDNKVVTFKSNPNYYKGQPKIPVVMFKETNTAEVATAVIKGEIDAGEMTAERTRFAEVQGANSNGELTGDVVSTVMVDMLGYGYIGMNASTINVGGDPGSAQSKALRKALGTILAVYRDVSYDSYYGAAASVIQYPISNSSWAAPQASDFDYKQAFSTDAQGNNIYNANMTTDERYAAAKAAALTWFEAAGYKVENGKLVSAPAGAKLSYEAIVGGQGTGTHPSYMLLTMAKDTLKEMGMELTINDPSDTTVLWNTLNSGKAEIWCAAWSTTIDPDMYYDRHSANIPGRGGTDRNQCFIDDAQLDQYIMDARISDDPAFRKATHKMCLEIIMDWAVEIPAYQRKDCTIFSTRSVNMATLTPDITTFWSWMNDIEKLEMKE